MWAGSNDQGRGRERLSPSDREVLNSRNGEEMANVCVKMGTEKFRESLHLALLESPAS